jgi:alpha-amylase/alpha-mannosidase (GH57 family)
MTADKTTHRFICIHGHFYQPPRENPWLEAIEREEEAAPYHDWNERITAECYASNARSRVRDDQGKIIRISNNYEMISFNFGPTLLSWMEERAGVTLKGIQQADRRSQKMRQGHGNALAQAYNHLILPLADERDVLTQVRWGKADFSKRFGREPEGMWLPETAVDLKTLKVLSAEGIRFTILAPHQGRRFRPIGQKQWVETHGGINTRHPYWCLLPSGEKIALFFYDGRISHGIAFEKILENGDALFQSLRNGFDPRDAGPQLVHVATDGESYGHHRPFGDMALAYALELLKKDSSIQLTNYGQFLNRFPPKFEVEIQENTSWSCAHGLERWRADCGCRLGISKLQQAWRAPLREGLDQLKKELDLLFESQGGSLLKNPWQARDAYIQVLLDRSPENLDRFFRDQGGKQPVSFEDRVRILKLMEMQRHGLLMFTSCGWFFDEVSGLETTQILKYACRAIQLAGDFGRQLEAPLLSYLKKTPSNRKEFGNGERLWETKIRPCQIDLSQVIAHQAIGSIYQKDRQDRVYCYRLSNQEQVVIPQNGSHLVIGRLKVSSTVTLEEGEMIFSILHFGGVDFQCHFRPFQSAEEYETLKNEILSLYRKSSLGDVYDRIREIFEPRRFDLKDLFSEERQKLINLLLWDRVENYIHLLQDWVKDDTGTLIKLINMGVALPEPMKVGLSVIFDQTLRKGIKEALSPDQRRGGLEEFFLRSRELAFPLSKERVRRRVQISLEQAIQRVREYPDPGGLFEAVADTIQICRRFNLDIDLWNIQNYFLDACHDLPEDKPAFRKPYQSFAEKIEIPSEVIPWETR